MVLLRLGHFPVVASDFGSVEVDFISEEILPEKLDEAKARVLFEEALGKGIRPLLVQREAAVQHQEDVLAQAGAGVPSEGEEMLAEALVLDDFADVQIEGGVVLRNGVAQVRGDRALVRQKLFAQVLAVHVKQMRLLEDILRFLLTRFFDLPEARTLSLFGEDSVRQSGLVEAQSPQRVALGLAAGAFRAVEHLQRFSRVRAELLVELGLFHAENEFVVHQRGLETIDDLRVVDLEFEVIQLVCD